MTGDGGARPEADVQEARDGWLFLVGGTNRVRSQYRADLAGRWRLWRWRSLVADRAMRAEALGVRLLHAVVPEKVTVYADRFPELGIDWRLSPARRLGLMLGGRRGVGHVDLVGALRAARDREQLYFSTDTHWTPAGCLIAYEALCRAAGAEPRDDLLDRPHVDEDVVRDLGEKLDPPRPERSRSYAFQRDARRVHVGPLLAAYEAAGREVELHVGAHAVFRNEAAPSPLRVLLFGDSCAHFAPFTLTGMLAETFAELHFVWSQSVDWSHVARVRPDVMVCEMAERFMMRVPSDRFDLAAQNRERLARLA